MQVRRAKFGTNRRLLKLLFQAFKKYKKPWTTSSCWFFKASEYILQIIVLLRLFNQLYMPRPIMFHYFGHILSKNGQNEIFFAVKILCGQNNA